MSDWESHAVGIGMTMRRNVADERGCTLKTNFKRRCEMIIAMGRRRDELVKLGDRDGLLLLADEYAVLPHESAQRIAKEIQRYCEGTWPQ